MYQQAHVSSNQPKICVAQFNRGKIEIPDDYMVLSSASSSECDSHVSNNSCTRNKQKKRDHFFIIVYTYIYICSFHLQVNGSDSDIVFIREDKSNMKQTAQNMNSDISTPLKHHISETASSVSKTSYTKKVIILLHSSYIIWLIISMMTAI